MATTIKPPVHIRLEASSLCNLRCPLCPTTRGGVPHQAIGGGFLRFEDFRKLLNDNPGLKSIELSNSGEIFLNPALLSVLELAHERGVELKANSGVNLNKIRPEVLEGLVRYQFRSLVCSIDGASEATYSIYRVRGKFANVIDNIRKINELKQRYNSPFPELCWKFIVFGHNEDEVLVAREMARELGMDFFATLNRFPNYSPVRDPEAVRAATGVGVTWDKHYSPVRDPAVRAATGVAVTWDEHEALCGYNFPYCHQLWDAPQINWDGKVLGCCMNTWGDFGGNAFRDGLTASINTEQIQYARAMLLGSAPSREDIPCTRCDEYQKMSERDAWLERAPPRLKNWSRRVPTVARPTLRKIYWGVYRRAQRWLQKRTWAAERAVDPLQSS